MFKENSNKLIEYLSLILVLSFFLLHNIYIVLAGLCISIYELKKDQLNLYMTHVRSENLIEERKKSVEVLNTEYSNKELNKESSKESLAELIEDLGYIPARDRNDEDRAA